MSGAPYDPRERATDDLDLLRAAMKGHQASVHTALPGTIVSFNPAAMTAVVQPAIQRVQRFADGTFQHIDCTQLTDVPVHFPGGGGYSLTFPVKPGDECQIIFQERSIDNWFQQGAGAPPSDLRMHDMTDAICQVGVRSQPKVISGGVNTNTTQMRSDDGTRYFEVDNANDKTRIVAGTQSITIDNSAGTITLDTPVVNVTGVLNVTNTRGTGGDVGTFQGTLAVTGEVIGGYGGRNIHLTTHQHQAQGPNSITTPPLTGTE